VNIKVFIFAKALFSIVYSVVGNIATFILVNVLDNTLSILYVLLLILHFFGIYTICRSDVL